MQAEGKKQQRKTKMKRKILHTKDGSIKAICRKNLNNTNTQLKHQHKTCFLSSSRGDAVHFRI